MSAADAMTTALRRWGNQDVGVFGLLKILISCKVFLTFNIYMVECYDPKLGLRAGTVVLTLDRAPESCGGLVKSQADEPKAQSV